MRNRPLTDIKDEVVREHIRFIQENASDKEIIVVTTEPTATTLPVGERRRFGDFIYENVSGNVIKYAIVEI